MCPPGESTALSTGCAPVLRFVEDLARGATRVQPRSLSPQVSGDIDTLLDGSHPGRDRGRTAVPGKLGDCEGNKPPPLAARRHPQAVRTWSGDGLTRSEPSAYRWPVGAGRKASRHLVSTGAACPRTGSFLVVGERCQPMRHTADPRPVHSLHTTERETREQAYVPAEQPSPAQGPRIPPAHAHPCRSRDPLLASPQGPQEPVGLSRPSPARHASHVECGPPAHRERALLARDPDGSASRQQHRRRPSGTSGLR